MKEKIIRWLIEKFLPGYHLSKNPDRKKKEVKNGGGGG
jgi:hypothetical protein